MSTSQNGWPAIPTYGDPRLKALPWITGDILAGDVWTVLDDVCRRFAATVESIVRASSWGYGYRAVRGGTDLSNHASGTAIDLDADAHPLGKQGTFTAPQVTAIHAIIAAETIDGVQVVRWGGDYSGRKDEMHWEINADASHVARLAARIRDVEVTPATPKPTVPLGAQAPAFPLPKDSYFGPREPLTNVHSISGYYSHREDLRRWQTRMAERGWTITADGRYGPQTATVAHDFQQGKGLPVDGLIGPDTWAAAWTTPVTP